MAKSKINLKQNFYFDTGKDKEFFFQNIALMVSSGINIVEALAKFSQEYKSNYIKELCQKFTVEIENGNSFTSILEKEKIIPAHSLSILKIAEASGTLSDALKMVVEQLQKEKEFRAQLRSAAIYPVIVVVLLVVVALGMGMFVIPKFSEIYKSLDVELPWLTRVIIDFGTFMSKNGLVVVPLTLGGMGSIIYLLFMNNKTRRFGQALLLATPGISNIMIETEVARMAYILSSLLSRGFQVFEAVEILNSSTSLYRYQKFYDYLYESINQGVTLAKCFSEYKGIKKLFPLYVRQLIGTSEETGELTQIMAEVNVQYTKKNELSSKNLAVLIEPFLLITIAVAVGVITIAVLLPMYNLMGNITDLASPSTSTNNQTAKEDIVTDNTTKVEPRLLIIYTEPGAFKVYDEIVNGNVIAEVTQGQVYRYSDSKDGWYLIRLNNTTSGWIDGKYTKIF
jgi:type IV pilus assembly protein PilC